MIVKQALSGVEHVRFAESQVVAEMAQHVLEVIPARFVRADILRRVDRIEGDAELFNGSRNAVSMDVRQDDKLEPAFQVTERVGRIRERGPMRQSFRKVIIEPRAGRKPKCRASPRCTSARTSGYSAWETPARPPLLREHKPRAQHRG